ncbi:MULTISPECIES: DUF423 domain-containing protein [unclassified Bartonella]|uniref:DUF423 domain-containing protein n=1 Tax=unclassified Bartonella TaxID=2645622 RepID=UPI001FEF0D38|nr:MULTISPECIES: DUF423 domain-containing protein [unclassified Bartonella]UXN05620.1 DUF423 domain-containing protein [Bartonella sp. HY761]
MMVRISNRIFCFAGGVFGAAGMASYAAASHVSQSNYGTIAPILLGHGILLVALALADKRSMFTRLSGALIVLGVTLFVGDLLFRQTWGIRLFSYAAPIGGMTMIFGWLFFCLMAFLPGPAKESST